MQGGFGLPVAGVNKQTKITSLETSHNLGVSINNKKIYNKFPMKMMMLKEGGTPHNKRESEIY